MAELDELGLLWQPHISAGRIPTDKGYRYYIDSLLEIEQLTEEECRLLKNQYPQQKEAFDELLLDILRILSNFSRYTALGFSFSDKERFYFAGASCILEQPEFQDTHKFQSILRTFEQPKALISIMKRDLGSEGVKVYIGKENCYQDIRECSLVISNFKINKRSLGVLGIIGPQRMSYSKVMSTVDYMARILNERTANPGL
jgi:heat-inducible transcriptional repressor